MDINWAINEINLLQEYYKENKAFKNICKSLKDIVVIFNSFEIEALDDNDYIIFDKHTKECFCLSDEMFQKLFVEVKEDNDEV